MSRKGVKQFGFQGGPWLSVPGIGGVFDVGTTVPAAASVGYAPGAIFIDIDASAGSQLWVNEGSATNSSFVRIPTASNASGTNGTFTNLTATNLALSGTQTMAGNSNIAFSATNGSSIATNNTQLMSFWGGTPVVQPAFTGELVGLNGNAATNINATNMNSNGNVGSTNYTFNDLVKDLKTAGIIKS